MQKINSLFQSAKNYFKQLIKNKYFVMLNRLLLLLRESTIYPSFGLKNLLISY